MASLIKVTLKRSLSKCTTQVLDTLKGLGLKHRHQTRYLKDTKPIRGMVLAVQHMIDAELVEGPESLRISQRLRKARSSQGGSK